MKIDDINQIFDLLDRKPEALCSLDSSFPLVDIQTVPDVTHEQCKHQRVVSRDWTADSETLRQSAQLLWESRCWKAAGEIYEHLAARNSIPQDIERAALCFRRCGDLPRAYAALCRLPPDQTTLFLPWEKARASCGLLPFSQTLALYEMAYREDPNHPEVLRELAAITHDPQRRQDLLQHHPDIHRLLARLALCRGDFEQALRHYEQVIRFTPKPTDALKVCITLARRLGNWEKLLEFSERMIALHPLWATWYELRVEALETLQHSKEIVENARQDLSRIQQYAPVLSDVLHVIELHNPGQLDIAEARLTEAIDAFFEVVEQIHPEPFPAIAPFLATAAYLYFHQRQAQRALYYCHLALEFDPTCENAIYYQALIHDHALGQYDKAFALYESLSQEFTQEVPMAIYNSGVYCSHALKDERRAIPYMSRAIEAKDDFAWAYNNRAYGLFCLGEYPQAEEDILLSLRHDDSNAPAWLTYAALLVAAGPQHYDRAFAITQKALDLGCPPASILEDEYLKPLHSRLIQDLHDLL
jgi:tetratricopeptide (TPR) repeat protein